jgi:hypothetical protein
MCELVEGLGKVVRESVSWVCEMRPEGNAERGNGSAGDEPAVEV